MGKTQAEQTSGDRGERQTTMAFDPTQALAAIEPLFQASNKLLENWMAAGSEILEFGQARLDRTLEVSKALASSGNIGQAMELQADLARSAVREYFTVAGKLADLSTRSFLDSLMAWRPVVREATRRTTVGLQAAAE
jgi:hypothetical protein